MFHTTVTPSMKCSSKFWTNQNLQTWLIEDLSISLAFHNYCTAQVLLSVYKRQQMINCYSFSLGSLVQRRVVSEVDPQELWLLFRKMFKQSDQVTSVTQVTSCHCASQCRAKLLNALLPVAVTVDRPDCDKQSRRWTGHSLVGRCTIIRCEHVW